MIKVKGMDLIFKDKKLLLFNLDGTLVDSAPDLALAINHMLRTLGREIFSPDLIRSWVGDGAQILVKRALSGSTVVDENIDTVVFAQALNSFLSFYEKNLCIETVTYSNVLETLQDLQSQNYRLALVTNKPFDFIEPLLIGLGLSNIFEFTLGGDSLSRKKPDPMPLLHVCESLHVDVSECVMIGDSKNDILAAKAAGMQSIGVTYGYNYGEDVSIYEPEAVIDDMNEIISLLA